MSLSDCEKCWDTPCTCGYEFRNYPTDKLIEFILSTLNYREHTEAIKILQTVTDLKSKEPMINKTTKEQEEKLHLVCGGIYTEKNPDERDPQAPYGIWFGGNGLHFLFDGIEHIEEITELACMHKMMLVEGYALAINKLERKWYIRNSARKHEPDYIIAQGCYDGPFEESLKKYLKIFHK